MGIFHVVLNYNSGLLLDILHDYYRVYLSYFIPNTYCLYSSLTSHSFLVRTSYGILRLLYSHKVNLHSSVLEPPVDYQV